MSSVKRADILVQGTLPAFTPTIGYLAGQSEGHRVSPNFDNDAKAELKVGGRTCQCGDCGEFFTGESSFTRHLMALGTDHVGCRTPKAMLAIGMQRNSNGVWMFGVPKKVAEGREV